MFSGLRAQGLSRIISSVKIQLISACFPAQHTFNGRARQDSAEKPSAFHKNLRLARSSSAYIASVPKRGITVMANSYRFAAFHHTDGNQRGSAVPPAVSAVFSHIFYFPEVVRGPSAISTEPSVRLYNFRPEETNPAVHCRFLRCRQYK